MLQFLITQFFLKYIFKKRKFDETKANLTQAFNQK